MRVSDFNNIVQGNDLDLARNNLYSIEVYMPRGHGGEFGNFYTRGDLPGIKEKLSYMAKTVTLPSKALGTMDTKRFGPVGKVANDLIIDTASMTFMCSADYKEHLFFDGWISGIMGQIKNPKNRQVYTLSYYNDYVSQVNIIPLDRQGGAAAQVTLKEAYPTNLGPIEFAWSDAGEVATFTVTWTFRDWNHTQTLGWSADTDRPGLAEWDFAAQEYREAPEYPYSWQQYPGTHSGKVSPSGRYWSGNSREDSLRGAAKYYGDNKYPGTLGESKDGFRESPGEIRKAKLKMGSGLDGLNAPITPIGRSTKGFREAPDNRNNKYPGVPGESKDGFRESPAVIKAEKNKMGSGLDHLNVPIGRSTKGFREAPGNRNNKYPGVPGESKDGFREAPSKWVNPDTIPSHKTRPAPGHDGSLVKGLKGLLNILIR